ncbi:hypothetical protein [Marichromatium gracile]|uniref:hypothetical protein n=1 Tax=Marichromatium gracile TaxID=1048 RepID=UPI00104F3CC9|nr:hypothetical protein [Marichromatium gracile]MBK1710681.1 hypothetical protein [Marichromatium gracile]
MLCVFAVLIITGHQPSFLSSEFSKGVKPYFDVVWTIQATITAVVYPIIIAFVAILLQRRQSSKVDLQIYLYSTAALPAGLSALGLIGALGLQYLVAFTLAPQGAAWGMIASLCWFTINVCLTGCFLYSTISFLHDDNRLRAFEQYAVHIALPREVRQYLNKHIMWDAQQLGLLPGRPSYQRLDSGADQGPSIDLMPYGTDGTPCVTRRLRRRSQLSDVRMRLFAAGLSRWLAQARTHWQGDLSHDADARAADLELRVEPGDMKSGNVTLLVVKNGPQPDWLARLLIRRAFMFRSSPGSVQTYNTGKLLQELVSDLKNETAAGREDGTQERLLALTHVHTALLDAGRFVDENGAAANVACMKVPAGFGSLSLYQTWVSDYSPWLECVIGMLESNPRGFELACHVTHRLAREVEREPLEIPNDLLRLHGRLIFLLGLWWLSKVEDQGSISHDAAHEAQLRAPRAGIYGKALRQWVGGWELIRLRDAPEPITSVEAAWKHATLEARFSMERIQQTAEMVFAAVVRGDTQAARLVLGSFFNWFAQTSHRYQNTFLDGYLPPTLTVSALDAGWAEIWAQYHVSLVETEPSLDAPTNICGILVKRFWEDLRHLLILLLLEASKDGKREEPAMQVVLFLLRGYVDDEESLESARAYRDAQQVLLLLIRQHYASQEYMLRLNDFLNNVQRHQWSEPIPGRVYTLPESEDLSSLSRSLLLLLLSLAPAREFSVDTIERFALSQNSEFDARLHWKAQELARELSKELEDRRQSNSGTVGAILKHASIIREIRAGLSPSPDAISIHIGNAPPKPIDPLTEEWVTEATKWLGELPEKVQWV